MWENWTLTILHQKGAKIDELVYLDPMTQLFVLDLLADDENTP